jgi:hypothetical protein
MAARVVEGANVVVVQPHDDHRLVEDLVLHEVATRGNLLGPARHLPHPGPEQFGLERVELLVVVALLGIRSTAWTAHGTGSGVRFTSVNELTLCPGVENHGRRAIFVS